jgi:c-di-GMP-binding flagellar brake protein YcgR
MDLNLLTAVRPGDKLEIHHINKLNQDVILDTNVYDIISEDEFLIHNPLKEGKLYMIPLSIVVTVFAKRPEYGVIAFKIQLMKRKKVGNVYTIVCKVTSNFIKQQRRNFFRVNTYQDIDIYYMKTAEGEEVKYYIFDPDAVDEEEVDLKVTITDISGGGVGLRSKVPLEEGTFIYGNLKFLQHNIELVGKVVRCVPSHKFEGTYELGILYVDMPPEDIRHITAYVFNKQQQARRKERT